MAATLDGGPGTAAPYEAAAAMWRLPGFWLGAIELSRQRGVRSRPPSAGRLHLPRYLPESHLTVVRGVPVTTLPRTIFDLAGQLHPARTERIVASVIGKSPGTLRVLHRLLPERVNQILREGGEPIVERVLWEVDSQLHHSSPLDLAHDAARDEALRAIGLYVQRIPEEHVWYRPDRVLATVRAVRREARPAAA